MKMIEWNCNDWTHGNSRSAMDVIKEFVDRNESMYPRIPVNPTYGITKPKLNIKNVIFNPPATIILWSDNTKSVVKCQNDEQFDAEKGFALAYLKKLLGNDNTFNKEIHKWVKYEEPKKEEPKKEEVKWRVVDRRAKAGDYIRLKCSEYTFDRKGDILKVYDEAGNTGVHVLAKDHPRDTGAYDEFPWTYIGYEFEVVEKCKE